MQIICTGDSKEGKDTRAETGVAAGDLLKNGVVNSIDSGAGIFYCQVLESKTCCFYYCYGEPGGFGVLAADDITAAFYAVLLLEGLLHLDTAGAGDTALRTGECLLLYQSRLQVCFSGAGQNPLKMVVIRITEQRGRLLMAQYGLQHKKGAGSGAPAAYCLHKGKLFLTGGIYQLCSMLEHARHGVLLEPFYEWLGTHILELQFARAAGFNHHPVFSKPGTMKILEEIKTKIDSSGGRQRTTDTLVNSAGLSENELQKAFKQVYGKSIGRYILGRRMEAAKAALQRERVPVKAIARRYGYKTVTGFIKAFKSFYGYTPGEGRKK